MTTLSPPGALERATESATARHVALAVLGGIAFDLGIRSDVVSVGGALAALTAAAGLASSGRVRTGIGRTCIAVAATFGAFLALRASFWLVPIDMGLIVAGLVGAAVLGRDASATDAGPGLLLGRLWAAARPFATGATFLLGPLRRPFAADRTGHRRAGAAGIGRGVLLTLPVVAVLGGLLASADAVFANFARVDHVLPSDILGRITLVVIGALLLAGLLHVASSTPGAARPGASTKLGVPEWTVVLAGVVTLFALFAVSQVVAAVGAGHRVLATEDLTYAEYARAGYFQLLAVAGLTAGLLVTLGIVADRSEPAAHRRFAILAAVAIGLTLVILGVAVRRLALYESAYGWTMLRLMVKASAVWLALSFVLLGARLAGAAAERSWLLPAVTAIAVVIAFALNLADPESAVARHNIARGAAGHEVDPDYLLFLSDDAVPALVHGLPSLPPAARAEVLASICVEERSGGGLSWNRSVARADDARAQVCG